MMTESANNRRVDLPPSLDKNQTIKVIAISDKLHQSQPSETVMGTAMFNLDLKPVEEMVDFPNFSEEESGKRYNVLLAYSFYGSAVDSTSEGLSALHIACSTLLLDPLKNQSLRAALKDEGIILNVIDGDTYLETLLDLLSDDLRNLYTKVIDSGDASVQKVALALFGPYFCLLGKKLSTANATRWGEKISRALYSALGLIGLQDEIGNIYPSYLMAISFHGTIASKITIRTGIVNGLLEQAKGEKLSGPIKVFNGVILSRLAFTDLGNFRLIDTYILRTNMYMLLWGWVAISMPDLKKAYERFESFGEKAPYIKLITKPNDCPEFASVSIKKLAELSRLIGISMGQQQLSQVTTGFKFPNEEMVISRIKAVMNAGSTAAFVWSDTAGEYIAAKSDNKDLYGTLSGKDLLYNNEEPTTSNNNVTEINN